MEIDQGHTALCFFAKISVNGKKLKERGVEFTKGIEDHGYGFVTFFKVLKDSGYLVIQGAW